MYTANTIDHALVYAIKYFMIYALIWIKLYHKMSLIPTCARIAKESNLVWYMVMICYSELSRMGRP